MCGNSKGVIILDDVTTLTFDTLEQLIDWYKVQQEHSRITLDWLNGIEIPDNMCKCDFCVHYDMWYRRCKVKVCREE